MTTLEIRMCTDSSANSWKVEIYNSKYGCVVLERDRTFETAAEARCWFDTVATLDKEYEDSFRGRISDNDLQYAEKLLDFRYTEIA